MELVKSGELLHEIVRLKALDRQHRRISEEAEQAARDKCWQAKNIAQKIEEHQKKIRRAYESGQSPSEIDRLWGHCIQEVSRLKAL